MVYLKYIKTEKIIVYEDKFSPNVFKLIHLDLLNIVVQQHDI